MRKMISNTIASKLAVQDGKIGTMINEGSFMKGGTPVTDVSSKVVLVEGITGKGNGWSFAAGPFDYTTFQEGTLTLITIADFGYSQYVLRVGNEVYELTSSGGSGTFTGNLKVNRDNLQYHETITVGNVFKAFKLED